LEINKIVIVASSWSSIFTFPTLMMHGQTQIKSIWRLAQQAMYTFRYTKNTCWLARGQAFNMTSTRVQRKIQNLWNNNCVYCLHSTEHSRINVRTAALFICLDSQSGVCVPPGVYETGHLGVREKIEKRRKKTHTSTV
jgi:hypothetical protein